jgi:hypothetical protein
LVFGATGVLAIFSESDFFLSAAREPKDVLNAWMRMKDGRARQCEEVLKTDLMQRIEL